MHSFPSVCRIHLTQGICSHAWIWHAYCYAPRSLYHHKHAAVVSQSLHKPTLWHLLPAHTHATGTSQSWPVWSANLKRKMRSWWGAEGLVQRRPVEGCRAEKILCGTNTKKKKNMEKKKGRKREEKNNNYCVNEDERGKTASFLAPTHSKSTRLILFFFSWGRNNDEQGDWSLTENRT